METPQYSDDQEYSPNFSYDASQEAVHGENGTGEKRRQGKNIVICCDGTGNVIGGKQSNVVKLVRTILRDHKGQCVFYDPGVGTISAPEAMTRVSQLISKVLGLAIGRGIRRNIEEAYLYLMEHYKQGDKVFLFGFSRGAYTVCSLAALLHKCGLMEPGNENLVPLALQVYQKSKKDPDGAQLVKATFGRECKPHFLGIWDTVASVGLIMNGDPFPSAAMNPDVRHVRHAVSIDERRMKFQPESWVTPAEAKEQTVKEVWFAGVHSDVGGGYEESESGLSKVALEWLLKEAIEEGLEIHEENCVKTMGLTEEIASYKYHYDEFALPETYYKNTKAPDHNDKLHNSLTLPWIIMDLLLTISPKYRVGRRRKIGADALVHESVLKRWRDAEAKAQDKEQNRAQKREPYKPANLKHKIDSLPVDWKTALDDPKSDSLPNWVIRRKKIVYSNDPKTD